MSNKKEVICNYCNTTFLRYPCQIGQRNFCSRSCKNLCSKGKTLEEIHGNDKAAQIKQKISLASAGENNGNFGNTWSDEQKQKQSQKVKIAMDEMGEEKRRELCGSSNRGKTRSKEFLDNWHKCHKDPNYKKPKMSKETKTKIGKSSSERMNSPEMLARIRKKNEEIGKWIPLEHKTDFEIYYKLANWKYRMWDLIDDESQLELLKNFGVFHCKTNSIGVVRDHIFGRKDGFLIGLFPEILRHPVNCQILLHKDNVSKKKKQYEDRSDITLEILFEKIEKYTKFWEEQNLVLSLIQQYKEGQRWINPNL